ncbi:putative F-box protein At5g62660 isoform X1 [Raphanus sativus]|uniref:F-box protein At5g62660 isoform X1 n=1 Tax=Raphanus sativus TaxID=3726 RepID=A0A9W3CJI0_RAPSA|nr:putative F-box protein At5g62660 isoform X1 [Raphanus sativus]
MEDMGVVDRMVILRGLILYTFCRKACIYNPVTRQSLTLPANICAQPELRRHKTVNYFFGHDPVLDQYKIVCNVFEMWETSKFWVFVLEPGGFWKRIEDDDKPHNPSGRGLCINGVIYYLAYNNNASINLSINVVYCFDVRSEKLRVIQAPREVSPIGRRLSFIDHGGKPTLFDFTLIGETGVSELWVLEDGLVGTWSRKSLVLKPCQRHLLDDIIVGWMMLHGTGQNNQVILEFPHRCYLFCYDLIKNDLRKVNIIRESTYMQIKLMDKCDSIMHLEI